VTLEANDATPAGHGVLLTVAYDGRRLAGYARQPNARTVAGELDGAVRSIDPRATVVRGASRTDAGVHARGQRVAFDAELSIPSRGWVMALNAALPDEIVVRRAATITPCFEPRFHAVSKVYRYLILEGAVADPFLAGRCWRLGDRLNHEAMQRAVEPLIGEHDFAAFRAAGDERTDTVRRLLRIEVRRTSSDDPKLTEIIVEGNRFMYRMVRIIVGSMVDVAVGRLDAARLALALEERDRALLGRTAPPDGLCLDSIRLDDEGTDSWPIDEIGSVA
jgi:tRNA pseudouridine38-40 synthase